MVKSIQILILVSYMTTAFSQGRNNDDAKPNQLQIKLKPDTIEVVISRIVFINKDTTLNCFIVKDTLGIVHTIASKERLEAYLTQADVSLIITEDYLSGYFVRVFKFSNQIDTINSYLSSKIQYFDGDSYRRDNIGIPLLEYDVEHSYILQQMNQIISSKFVYVLIINGTERFYTFPPIVPKESLLIKVDKTQDSTYNIFRYKAKYISNQGLSLTAQDSITLPLKRLSKKHGVLSAIEELLKTKRESDVYSQNFNKTYILIADEKRFVVSANTDPKKDEKWIVNVERISLLLEELIGKNFD